MSKMMNVSYGVLSLISIIILVKIYHYLVDLESCPCFKSGQHEHYKVDIEYMKFYQVLEIITTMIFVVSSFLARSNSKFMKGGSAGMRMISIMSFLILIYIFGYMSYNVFSFYMSMKDNCKCANKWQKYFIYVQGISSSLSALQLLFGFLLTVMIILTSITF